MMGHGKKYGPIDRSSADTFGTVGIGYDRMRQIKRHYEGAFRLAGVYAQNTGRYAKLKETAAGYYCRIGASCTGSLSVLLCRFIRN